MTKIVSEEFGLIKGDYVEVIHTSGPKNGQTFLGTLNADVEIKKPILIDDHGEVTSKLKNLSPEGKREFVAQGVDGSSYAIVKKDLSHVFKKESTICY